MEEKQKGKKRKRGYEVDFCGGEGEERYYRRKKVGGGGRGRV